MSADMLHHIIRWNVAKSRSAYLKYGPLIGSRLTGASGTRLGAAYCLGARPV